MSGALTYKHACQVLQNNLRFGCFKFLQELKPGFDAHASASDSAVSTFLEETIMPNIAEQGDTGIDESIVYDQPQFNGKVVNKALADAFLAVSFDSHALYNLLAEYEAADVTLVSPPPIELFVRAVVVRLVLSLTDENVKTLTSPYTPWFVEALKMAVRSALAIEYVSDSDLYEQTSVGSVDADDPSREPDADPEVE